MYESGAECAKYAKNARGCSEVYGSGVKWHIQAENGVRGKKTACVGRKSLKYLTNA